MGYKLFLRQFLVLILVGTAAGLDLRAATLSVNSVPGELPCQAQVFGLLDRWPAPLAWKKLLIPGVAHAVESPTDKVGVWLKLKVLSGQVVAEKTSLHSRVVYSFSKLNCEARVELFKKTVSTGSKDFFTDQDLAALMQQSQSQKSAGVILVWSPYMSISIKALSEIKPVLKEMGLDLHALMAPHSRKAEARKVLQKYNIEDVALRSLASTDLVKRGASLHFPTMIFYRHGKIEHQSRFGYHKNDVLLERLKRWFGRK